MKNCKINLNGDTAESLSKELSDAWDALTEAKDKFRAITINGRNYQTTENPGMLFQRDRDEFETHFENLGNAVDYLMDCRVAIADQTQ